MKNSVRECREELRITQQDLANRVGVSRQSIISIEKGKYDPSLALAFKLSAVLERGIEELFTPPGAHPTELALVLGSTRVH